MQLKKFFVTALLSGVLCVGAHAQPNLNNGQANNPPNQVPFGNFGPDWQKMTPEQRREALLKMTEQMLRGGMDMLNYQDKAMQDTVVAFALEQEKALEPVREKHRKVAQALVNNAITEQQVGVLMDELREAEAQAREKRGKDIQALEQQIHFSEKPRLDAFLSLTGLTGEQTGFISGVLGSIMTSMANLQANAAPPNLPAGPPPVANNRN
jgi:hypothetical protein